MQAPILPPGQDAIAEACRVLNQGGLVAIPTETVYGLAADARNPKAVARLYAVKNRPQFNPLIAHVNSVEAAQKQGQLTPLAVQLARTFWPGPLTLITELSKPCTVCELARAGLDSLGLRVPDHPVALELLKAFGAPLVAPSANPSGQISPTTAGHVAQDLGDRIDLILDGGACRAGLESTIIDARQVPPALLRAGSLDCQKIAALTTNLQTATHDPAAPRAPGQTLRHYAPQARLRLNAGQVLPGEALLGFGPGPATLNLSETGDLEEAAHHLFAMLRQLDEHYDAIAVAPIPQTGLGEAINDRLNRAAQSHREIICP